MAEAPVNFEPVVGIKLTHGMEVYVDCSAYGVEGFHWCRVDWVAHGTASVYPIKFDVPGKGTGQCKAEEVLGVRTPDWLIESRLDHEHMGIDWRKWA